MKPKYLLKLSLTLGVGLGSLTSYEVQAQETTTKAEVGYVRDTTSAKEGSIEQLAKTAGFAQYLPVDSEMYVSVIGIESMVAKLRSTKLGSFFETLIEKEEGMDMDEALKDSNYRSFMDIAGEEVFFATGKGNSAMLDSIMQAMMEINKWSYDNSLRMMLSQIDPELIDMEKMQNPAGMMPDFLKDKDGGVKFVKDLEVAPIYAGFKVSDKVKRDKYVSDIMLAMDRLINSSDVRMMRVADSKAENGFYGFQWNGKGFLEMMAEQEPDMENGIGQMIGKDILNAYKEAIAEKKLACMVGTVGDYVVFFVGTEAKSLKLEKSAATSLLSNPEMSFAKKHADKELASLMYVSESTMKTLYSVGGGLKQLTDAFSKILSESEAFGDTRKLRDLLKKAGDREQDFYKMMPAQKIGLVASYDKGLKIDTYYGKSYPSLDLETPRKLTKMVNHPDAIVFGSWIMSDEYSEKTMGYLEAIWNATYEGAKLMSALELDDEDMLQFQTYFKMFDDNFKEDVLKMWKSFNGDFADGVGSEFAMIMDLKGKMPRVPKVPSVILENGEIPRLTIIKPVVDRDKISKAWKDMDTSSNSISKTLNKLMGMDVTMLKPEKATRFGLDTWSYQLGVTTKDANLAVAVNDDFWFMTTSPTGLENLMNRASSKNSGNAKPGAEMVIRMDPMRAAAKKWLQVIEQNGKELMNERDYKDFLKQKPMIENFLKASEEIDLIDSYTRKEGSEVQSTIHFKMK